MSKTKLIFTTFLYLLFATLISSCNNDRKDNIEYILGVSPDYPPFEYKQDGELVGFDIELAKIISKKLNIKIKISELDYSSLIAALKTKKIDFIMSSMSSTEERKIEIDFSDIYFQSSLSLIVQKDSDINKISDLDGKKVGAQLGSTMEIYLHEQKKIYPNMLVETLANNMTLIQQLKLKRIDALLVEKIQAIEFTRNNKDLKYITIAGSGDGYSIAFRKNSELTAKFNQVIEELKKDKTIYHLEKKWIEQKATAKSPLIASITAIPPGMLITLQYALTSVTFGFIIGIVLSIFKVSRFRSFRIFASIYTSIFRGTPLLVQLSLVYFALPVLINVDLSVFAAGVIAFSLNSGAYISEIIRAGIQSVDKGQFEAAKALGIPYSKKMKDIILPQAIRNILPSLVNEMINLLKESAIISVIGEADLMRRAQIVAAEQYSYFEPILVAAFCYYILVMIFSFIAKILEKKLKIK